MEKIVKEISERELKHGEEKDLYHLNCAEVLLMSADKKYKLGLDSKTIKAITPFGGGLYSERTCGALTGSIAALGLKYTEDKPTKNEKMKEITKELVKEFEKEFGSIECSYIKEHHKSETEGCNPVKIRAGKILERIIKNNE